MATHAGSHVSTPSSEPATLFARTARQLRQLICGLGGHDTLFHFDDHRVALKCASCGYESPGWRVPGAGPSTPTRAQTVSDRVQPHRAA